MTWTMAEPTCPLCGWTSTPGAATTMCPRCQTRLVLVREPVAEAAPAPEPEAEPEPSPDDLRRAKYRQRMKAAPVVDEPALPNLSAVGKQTGSGLACPRCGGAQFKTKRSTKWKAGLAGGAALTALSAGAFAPVLIASAATAKPKWVVCVTCAEVYHRG